MLPQVESYAPTGTGESPLADIAEWVNTKCPLLPGRRGGSAAPAPGHRLHRGPGRIAARCPHSHPGPLRRLLPHDLEGKHSHEARFVTWIKVHYTPILAWAFGSVEAPHLPRSCGASDGHPSPVLRRAELHARVQRGQFERHLRLPPRHPPGGLRPPGCEPQNPKTP